MINLTITVATIMRSMLESGILVTASYDPDCLPTMAGKCWICGGIGNSGEHRIKRAALAHIFSNEVNQRKPLHWRSGLGKARIGSLKAEKLKFPKNICQLCNSTETQENDRSWQCLFEFLSSRCYPLCDGDRINLWSVFPDSPYAGMTNVQLYFAKVMGSAIRELSLPIDLHCFSSSIMKQSPHPYLYLSFGTMPGAPKHAGLSDLEFDGSCANLIYTVGEVSANILYAPNNEYREGMRNSWHPMVLSDYLVINVC